jgi:hypothetical protein
MTAQIFITLGKGVELGIDNQDNLFVCQRNAIGRMVNCVELGKATKKRIKDLRGYLDQLKVCAVDA